MVPWLNWIEQPLLRAELRVRILSGPPIKRYKKKIIFDKKIICGIDEAGRGSWAGPVVSAAVILKNYTDLSSLKDSKILSSKKRKEIFEDLKKRSIIGVGFSSIVEIEKFNILQATFFSMRRAIVSLKEYPDLLLFDGNMVPPNMKIKSESYN